MTMAEKFSNLYYMIAVREDVGCLDEKTFLLDEKTFLDIQPKIYFADGTSVIWNDHTEQWEVMEV